MLVVVAAALAAGADAHALVQKRGKATGQHLIHPHTVEPRHTERRLRPSLRPRRYQRRAVDLARYQDVILPRGRDGAHYRLLRPITGGRFLIERTRNTAAGLERDFSILGFAGRKFERRTYCTRGCGAGQIDPSVYRQVKLGDVGLDRYLLWVPRSSALGPPLIERVVGVTNFADVSPLHL